MGNSIQSEFNNTFGSNITHVANAYTGTDFVWLLFNSTETDYEIEITIAKPPTATVRTKATKDIYEEIRVPKFDYHKKRRNQSTEYLTVFTYNRDGSTFYICKNYKILANRSFIITNNGSIKESVYGGSIWEEINGVNHYRSQ